MDGTRHSGGRIAVFFTGGTIGMREDRGAGGVVPGGSFQAILDHLEEQRPGLSLLPVNWSDKPSGHMTPQDMLVLSREVARVLEDADTLGAVVLHGTDVIVETAFLLDLALDTSKPVVFTGSMRYSTETGYDGLRNLQSALAAVALPLPPDMGVVLLMNDRLFAARDVVKLNSMNVDAFESFDAGILGFVAGRDVVLAHPSRFEPRRVLAVQALEEDVPLIACYTGMGGHELRLARERGCRGAVLEGFGAGNVPPGLLDELSDCLEADMAVVLATRCAQGGVWPIYAYPGGGADLVARGVLLGGRLDGPRARLLLMAALGAGLDREAIGSLLA